MDITRALPWLAATIGADETGPAAPYEHDDARVVRPWAADLGITYVVEDSDALSFVRRRDLRGVDPGELHEVALANLRARASTHLRFQPDGPIVGVFLDGKLDPSVLLLDDAWEREDAARLAPIVAAPAARDVLVTASASSREGVAALRAIAARGDLSQHLLVREAGRWRRYA